MGTSPALALDQVYTFPKRASSKWLTSISILIADLFALSIVYMVSITGRYSVAGNIQVGSYLWFLPCTLLLVAAFSLQDLYPGVLLHPAEEMRRVFYAFTSVFLLVGCESFLWRPTQQYSRSIFLFSWFCGIPAVLVTRSMMRSLLQNQKWWGVPVVILGSNSAAERIIRSIQSAPRGVKLIGVLSDDSGSKWHCDLPPLLGTVARAPGIAKAGIAQYAIVLMPEKSNVGLRSTIQESCRGFSHVLLIPDMAGFCSIGICAREVGGTFGLEMPQRLFHQGSACMKRLVDLVGSLLALIVLSPFVLVIACAIKVTTPGPVIYKQKRHGKDGSTFFALKFRTMVVNAEDLLSTYLEQNASHKAEWVRDHKLKNDPRVTVPGKWLRRFSLDELPQLLNVFLGQMSLVGPRPIVQKEIRKYGAGYDLYVRVLPGLTGLWQISGRNNTSYEDRVSFDEYYVRNWSIWLDCYILMHTIKTVIKAEGAY